MMDTQRELGGIGDRVSALENGAAEQDARVFRGDEEHEMWDGEMGRVEERVLEKGDEVCRLGAKVAGVEEEISVRKKELEALGEKIARWERMMARLGEEGVFD